MFKDNVNNEILQIIKVGNRSSDYVLNCVNIHLFFFPGFILAKTPVCPRSSTLPEKDRTVLQGPGQQSCYNRCWFLEWDVSPQFGEFNYMLKDKIFSETNVMASFNTIVSSYITPLDNLFAGIYYALNYPSQLLFQMII